MQEIHCSAGWSTLLDLGKSAKGSPEREVPEHPTADFLVPLPEGEVLSPSGLKAPPPEPWELCKASPPSGSAFRMPVPPFPYKPWK